MTASIPWLQSALNFILNWNFSSILCELIPSVTYVRLAILSVYRTHKLLETLWGWKGWAPEPKIASLTNFCQQGLNEVLARAGVTKEQAMMVVVGHCYVFCVSGHVDNLWTAAHRSYPYLIAIVSGRWLPGSPIIRIANYPDRQLSGSPITRIANYPDRQLSGSPITRIANYPDRQLPGSPIIRIANYPDRQLSGSPITRIANYPDRLCPSGKHFLTVIVLHFLWFYFVLIIKYIRINGITY